MCRSACDPPGIFNTILGKLTYWGACGKITECSFSWRGGFSEEAERMVIRLRNGNEVGRRKWRDAVGERGNERADMRKKRAGCVCVFTRMLGSILMSAGSLPTPTTITAAPNMAPGLWNQTHYIWYWVSLRSDIMQCGLGSCKSAQCRIASLRKRTSQRGKKHGGGGGALRPESLMLGRGASQSRGAHFIHFNFVLLCQNDNLLLNKLLHTWDDVHTTGVGMCLYEDLVNHLHNL